MTLDTEVQFLRQLIPLNDNAAKVDNFFRTNHLDNFDAEVSRTNC